MESDLIGNKNTRWKLTFNAPFTLLFVFIAFVFVLANAITVGSVNYYCSLRPGWAFLDFHRYITYIFCHANWAHFTSNMLALLMLGPLLEEKYGAKMLMVMTLFTAIATGLLNNILFMQNIVGASGIVFMFIILSSLVNMRRKEIPLTFILVSLVFIGNEILSSFKVDGVSQFGHIVGGLCGGALGFFQKNAS